MKILGCFFLLIPALATAENYCGVSNLAPTHGMNVEKVEQLVWVRVPQASVECGVLKNLYKLETGNTIEEHYKNVVLLVDGDDERFVAVLKTGNLSVFAFTDNLGVEYHIAVKGEVARLRPLTPGALVVVEFKDVTLPDGFSLYMPVFERVL